MHDVLIIGGGVVGLSLAWDLARHGKCVRVIDRGQPGREASWAGAGILPAANLATAIHPYDQLCGLASQLHPQWAEELRRLTGIDTGYRRCGGLYLARTAGEAAALAAWASEQRQLGVAVESLCADALMCMEAGLKLSAIAPSRPAAFLFKDEAQIRNPKHLQALARACEAAGVEITPDVAALDLVVREDALVELATTSCPLRARRYCLAAGAWTGQLLARLGLRVGILPVRGQMVLFRCQRPPIRHIVMEGSRYIVPRDDGRVLAGSTEEEVGFDKQTTEAGIAELVEFACSLVPALADAPIEQTWAGLRPGSFDGLPYLSPIPGLTNAFVAAGHFRSGLFLSPATAVVMSQLLRNQPPQIELGPFRVGR
jgi:glycine oxidase